MIYRIRWTFQHISETHLALVESRPTVSDLFSETCNVVGIHRHICSKPWSLLWMHNLYVHHRWTCRIITASFQMHNHLWICEAIHSASSDCLFLNHQTWFRNHVRETIWQPRNLHNVYEHATMLKCVHIEKTVGSLFEPCNIMAFGQWPSNIVVQDNRISFHRVASYRFVPLNAISSHVVSCNWISSLAHLRYSHHTSCHLLSFHTSSLDIITSLRLIL